MNWDAWKPLATLIFTSLLKFVGGLLVAHGLATNGPGLEALGGAATTAAGALWSWWVQKGHIQAADYLKKLTDTATTAAAVAVAKQMAPAAATGAAQEARQEVAAETGKTVPKAVPVVLLAILILGALAFPGDAQAQGIKLKPLTGNIGNDLGLTSKAAPTSNDPLQNIIGALDAKLLPDLQYAKTMADASGSKVTGPCYGAWIDLINVRQKAVSNPDGSPMAFPDPGLISRFEQIVELRNALQPDSEFMIKCSPVASMVKKDIVGFIGIVISGGAGLATLVPGL